MKLKVHYTFSRVGDIIGVYYGVNKERQVSISEFDIIPNYSHLLLNRMLIVTVRSNKVLGCQLKK